MSFLFNNRKAILITIGIFSYWIGISYGRHVNSSFSGKFTCLLRKEYARNFIEFIYRNIMIQFLRLKIFIITKIPLHLKENSASLNR